MNLAYPSHTGAGLVGKSDLHTHTTYSPDGSSSPEEMCRRALSLGYTTIAFTEHAEWYHGMGGFVQVPDYFAAVADCRSRFTPLGLTILTGVELGNPHEFEKEVELLLDSYQFDVRIASLHWLYGRNIHLDDCFHNTDPQEIYSDYFIELGEMASRGNADIIAHFDRILLRGTERGAQPDLIRLESVIRNTLLTIAWRGIALEVNTRYLHSMPGWISALRTMLRWFRAEGGESIVVNSDAHHVDQISMNEDLALQLLVDAGFDEPSHLPEKVLAVAG